MSPASNAVFCAAADCRPLLGDERQLAVMLPVIRCSIIDVPDAEAAPIYTEATSYIYAAADDFARQTHSSWAIFHDHLALAACIILSTIFNAHQCR